MPSELPLRLHLKLLSRALAEQMAGAAEMLWRAEHQRAGVERSLRAIERISREMATHLARVRRVRLWWE